MRVKNGSKESTLVAKNAWEMVIGQERTSKPYAKSNSGVSGEGSGSDAYYEAFEDRINVRGKIIQPASLGSSGNSDTFQETENTDRETNW